MDLPLNPGDKYALIALEVPTPDFDGSIDLGGGLVALRGGSLRVPEHWREWIGSIESDAIEQARLLLLARQRSQRPDVLDNENLELQHRTEWLFWGLLATGAFRWGRPGTQLSGANVNGEISVRQRATLPMVFTLPGVRPERVSQVHLRRAAALATNLGELMERRRMLRRVKLAMRTFWFAFAEPDLGQRIHQFVRVVSDGFAKAFGAADFKRRCEAFLVNAKVARRQLYLIRNNAEHFNAPERRLGRLPRRRALERAYLRAHQAEALARHCVARFIERPKLWSVYMNETRLDAFWKQQVRALSQAWGPRLDLNAALATFEPRWVPDEGT
jgi:hypothetical protein